MNHNQLRWLFLIIISFIWGSSFILLKKSLIGLTPIQVGALRIIFTSITLFLLAFKSIFSLSKNLWIHILTTALLGTLFPVFLFAFAIHKIDSSIASILNSITPLNTLIVGVLFYGLTFLKKQLIGVIIGLIGAVFLILKGSQLSPDQNYYFALLIVIASIGYAFNINILKKYLNNVKALTLTTANFSLLFIPALIILWKTDFFEMEYVQTTKESLIYVVILSIFGTALAKTMFNKLVQMSSPIFSSSVTYLIPLVAIFWGFIDGENIHIIQLLTGSFILLGIYISNKGN